ncbi:ABC transporter permease [Pontibacterium granulatum]|uniref:ABC transporter permease n=1 Tax=Pontibacterium granulatum TaxID=2036029 RepID=UPI00249A3B95|nr:ABC transporter permease [Pontibacterium granulatum]MDI3326003.1 ABC transporter permease [Pontibacterium granulatum]
MHSISWLSLSWCLIPVLLISAIYYYWNGKPSEVLLSSARMALQLVAVGYVLVVLFAEPSPWITGLVLSVMICAASWIAIRPVRQHPGFLRPAFTALLLAVGFHLAIALKLVLGVETWYEPSVMIPLAGMFFSNSMNAISLAAERYRSELVEGKQEKAARLAAFHAAMIPQVNSLLAVGLVALPGMMTGQILSGVSPLIAVRYQIMIMTMALGVSGMGAALMLWQLGRIEIHTRIANSAKNQR